MAVERAVRARLGDDVSYELSWPERVVPGSSSPESSPLTDAITEVLADLGEPTSLLPLLGTGFTDSVYLRAAAGTTAYGFSPLRATSAEVLNAGFHNANERVHVDDLLLSTRFHIALAERVLG